MPLPDAITVRRLQVADAPALATFYNGLSEPSLRTFRPLAIPTTHERCARVCSDNEGETPVKYDLVALLNGEVIGWSFLWHLDADDPEKGPEFGLAVADAFHGQGLGSDLTCRVLAWADAQALPQTVLIVVQDNAVAQHIYEKQGFVRYGAFVEDGLDYDRMRRQR